MEIDLGRVEELYKSLMDFVQEVRSNFDFYENEAKSFSETEEYVADTRRQRTRKRHHDEISSVRDTEFTGRSKMIAEVNMMHDRLFGELQRRKQAYSLVNSRFGFLVKLPEMNVASIYSKATSLTQLYPEDIDSNLGSQCVHFKSYISEMVDDSGKIRTPNALDLLKMIRRKNLTSTFPNVDVALRIYLSTAVK